MYPIKSNSHRLFLWVAVTVISSAVIFMIGWSAGGRVAKMDKERLLLLWPDIMTMPETDRARVVRSAMKCELYQQPLQAEAVAACLRDGAVKVGEEDSLAAARVHQMLNQVGY